MALTKAGEALLPLADHTLTAAFELQSAAKKLQGEVVGALRLGTIIDPESIKVGQLLGALLQHYPLLQVRLQHGVSGGVLEQVLAGTLDAGFYLGYATDPAVASVLLTTMVYKVIAPAEWEARMLGASWHTLSTMPWVGTPPHSSQHRMLRQMMREQGYEPRFALEADQESSMINLVKNGIGLCLMREELADAAMQRGDVWVWPGAERPCPLMLVYPVAQAQHPSIVALLKTLKVVWNAEELPRI